MSKAEMARQSAAAENERHIERLASMAEQLRQEKIQSADELAEIIEPLAQAMAKLTDEMRDALGKTERAALDAMRQHNSQLKEVQMLTFNLQTELDSMIQRAQGWRHWITVLGAAILAGLAASVFLLYQAPPTPPRWVIDAENIAKQLAPAIKDALKQPSGSR